MKEITGNILQNNILKFGDAICVTTNGIIKTNGKSVMGAGIAKILNDKFHLDEDLAININLNGHVVQTIKYTYVDQKQIYFVSFPTKYNWKEKSSIELIEKSLIQLIDLTNKKNWDKVILPRPGCSNGGLSWLKSIKPLCQRYLDDRFYIISL